MTARPPLRRLLAMVLVAAAAFALVAALAATGAMDRLELLTRDVRIRSGLGRVPASEEILIAWIDQDSMDAMLEQSGVSFPWPRTIYGDALSYMDSARVVIFDILMSEPGIASDDSAFAEQLGSEHPCVFAFQFTERAGLRTPDDATRLHERGLALAPALSFPSQRGAVLPIPAIEKRAGALGFVNIRADADRVFRHADLVRTFDGRAYPSLSLAAAMQLRGEKALRIDARGLHLGEKIVPLSPDGRLALSFRGPEFTFRHIKLLNILESIVRVEEGEKPIYPKELFRDKIVIVGINAEGYADVHATPLSRLFPGPELHATALDNLLRGDALTELPLDLPLAGGAALLATAVVLWLPGVLWPAGAALALAGLTSAASLALFARGVVLPSAAPLAALVLATGGAFLWRLLVEGRQRRELRRAFSSYMAPELVAEVVREPEKIRLGGQLREVTVFFSDLAGFTTLAERTEPEELVAFLNEYFTRMGARVMERGGIIDKFIGDAIMALFGVPVERDQPPLQAVRAALDAQLELRGINADLAARGMPAVATRIGIHTGSAVIGNMGSERRFDYTAIGDAVNLASRLEGANKFFGTSCLVSASAWRVAGASLAGREVGLVQVVGRNEPIAVFEPLSSEEEAESSRDGFSQSYLDALNELRQGERERARRGFQAALALRPRDAVVRSYLERLDDSGWDGVFHLESK